MTIRLGVLASGSGSNLEAILAGIQAGKIDAQAIVLIANRPSAYALERAQRYGVEALLIDHKRFAARNDFDRALIEALLERGVEWVALAGFMRVLGPEFLRTFQDRVLNIHPALLPAFPGMNGPAQAFRYGVKVAGCTLHFVDDDVDTGPILLQAAVPVLETDDEAALAARILEQEHALYVRGLSLVAAGKTQIISGPDGRRRVRIAEGA